MEAAVLTKKLPAKRDKIHLLFEGVEVQALRSPMTDKEFEEFCFQNPNLRIEQDKHGNIIIMSPVSLQSGNFENEVNIDLGMWNRKHKQGMFILPDGEKRMADAAYISHDRLKKVPTSEWKKFAHVVPNFIVEVRSPSDSVKDLKAKISNVWMANGVQLAWLIDPVEQVAFIFKPNSEPIEIRGFDHRLSGDDVLPGFAFDLSILKEQP